MVLCRRCLVSIALLVVAGCAPPRQSQDSAPVTAPTKTLKLVERATTDATVDTGAVGDSAGDLLTFANAVFDAENKNQVGTDQGFCVRMVPGKSWECVWTMMLAEGQITVEGPFLDAGDSVLAITGGTGAYRNSRGEMRLHGRNPQGTEYDFIYELTP